MTIKTLKTYIKTLVKVYMTANEADGDAAQSWQCVEDSSTHCRAIRLILVDMCGQEAWEGFIRTDEIEYLYFGAKMNLK